MSDAADRHIRVSEEQYEQLARRKRPGESFGDVVARLLADDRDLLAGFGAAADRDRDMEAVHEATQRKSKSRIDEFSEGREET